MVMNQISEAERFRRSEHARDSRAALAQNENLEQQLAKRDAKADAWAKWFRHEMTRTHRTDPVELLPEALARIEQLVEDRIAVSVNDVQRGRGSRGFACAI
jgi:hypothetical protein